MIKILMIISVIIRQFYLPNPFESLGEWSIVCNLMLSGAISSFTFFIVGLYYTKGSMPVLGSLLYLVFFTIHTFLIMLMGVFNFAIWWIVLIIVGYITLHIKFNKV